MTALYDQCMASPAIKRDNRGYTEPPSRGLLAQWVKKAWNNLMERSSVPAGRRLACFFPSTARETKYGPGRSYTRTPKERLWTRIPARRGWT